MKKFTNYLFIMLMGTLVFLYSCDNGGDDPDPEPGAPSITSPSEAADVQVYGETVIDFTVNVEGGYASAEVKVSQGSVSVESEPAAGATSGTLQVKYSAEDAVDTEVITVTIKDQDNKTATTTSDVNVSNVLTVDDTWTADKIWYLAGRIIINDGVTLTIEPGTIIKGREGSGTNATVIIVARGGMIMAEGTADEPIIFTSVLDDIDIGEKLGTSLAKEDNEKWGGIIMLGSAPISAGEGDTESSIEGLPAEEPFAKYGGDAADDNSGVLKYVSIRHGGISIGSGNEINGLTLGGVGTGTTIENVEIFATLDDGIEFFGGTVNVKNVLVAWQGDDGVDIDQNYSGTVDNFVVTHGKDVDTDEGMEIDGPEGSTHTDGLFTLKNGTIINDGIEGSAADFKSKAQGNVQNVIFSGYAAATIKFRASYSNNCLDPKSDAFMYLTDASPKLIFTGCDFDGTSVYTESKNDDETADCTVPQADKDAANAKMTPDGAATGATVDGVFDWTAAAISGLL